jgi:hypothetical protein
LAGITLKRTQKYQQTLVGRISKRLQKQKKNAQTWLSWIEKKLYILNLVSKNQLNLPEFLIIGAQKEGTTWLRNNLLCHPDVFFPTLPHRSDPTEVRFFDSDFHRSLRYYSALFESGGERVRGDKSPNTYMISSKRIAFIRELMPEVRLILMLRNPIDRAWSHALMNLVRLPGYDYDRVKPRRFYSHFFNNRQKGEYTRILERWSSYFPKDQIFIGFYDQILTAPEQLLGDVMGFLGISTDVCWNDFPYKKRFNPGVTLPMPEPYREFLEEMYRQEIETLYHRFGEPVTNWRC